MIIKVSPNRIKPSPMKNIADVIIGQQILIKPITYLVTAQFVSCFVSEAPAVCGANKLDTKVTLIKTIHPI